MREISRATTVKLTVEVTTDELRNLRDLLASYSRLINVTSRSLTEEAQAGVDGWITTLDRMAKA